MINKTASELYGILRSGTDEEARQAEEELIYRDQEKSRQVVKAASAAICTRNFSHNAGENTKEELTKRMVCLQRENKSKPERSKLVKKYLCKIISKLFGLRKLPEK